MCATLRIPPQHRVVEEIPLEKKEELLNEIYIQACNVFGPFL